VMSVDGGLTGVGQWAESPGPSPQPGASSSHPPDSATDEPGYADPSSGRGDIVSPAPPLVDVTRLQAATDHALAHLACAEVITDQARLLDALSGWIGVLHETYLAMHTAKYCKKTSSSLVESDNVCDTDVCDQNNKTTDATNEDSSSQPSCHSCAIPTILQDSDFCYVEDPLRLPSNLFHSVSLLCQACFDTGCHGNILTYQQCQSCKHYTSAQNISKGGGNSDDCTDRYSECKTTTVQCDEHSINTENCSIQSSNSNQGANIHYPHIKSDASISGESHSSPAYCQDEEKPDERENNSVDVPSNGTAVYLTACASPKNHGVVVSANAPASPSIGGGAEHPDSGANSSSGGGAVRPNSGAGPFSGVEGERDVVRGQFVRWYLPYLVPRRVRQVVLEAADGFHTWSALTTAMEGAALTCCVRSSLKILI